MKFLMSEISNTFRRNYIQTFLPRFISLSKHVAFIRSIEVTKNRLDVLVGNFNSIVEGHV